jgi:hypothetical protein
MIADVVRRQGDTSLSLNELSSSIAREHRAAVAVDDDDEDEGGEAPARTGRAGRFYQTA